MINLQNNPKKTSCLINSNSFLKIASLAPYNDAFFRTYHYTKFCLELRIAMRYNNLISHEELDNFRNVYTLTKNVICNEEVSKYLYTSLRKASFILCDAILLNQENVLSDDEFITIAKTVFNTFYQKSISINKHAQKTRLKKSGLENSGLAKLRAQVATLNNEN